MALNGLCCADVPLNKYSLTHECDCEISWFSPDSQFPLIHIQSVITERSWIWYCHLHLSLGQLSEASHLKFELHCDVQIDQKHEAMDILRVLQAPLSKCRESTTFLPMFIGMLCGIGVFRCFDAVHWVTGRASGLYKVLPQQCSWLAMTVWWQRAVSKSGTLR